MKNPNASSPVFAATIPARTKATNYPEPFASRVAGREKKPLGDFFGIKNFGVNLTRLPPNTQSALLHGHSKQDEFIFILEGNPVLVTEEEKTILEPGMCAGFPASGNAHHLINETNKDVVYLEIGDRTGGDVVSYPEDDLVVNTDSNGNRICQHKDGRPIK